MIGSGLLRKKLRKRGGNQIHPACVLSRPGGFIRTLSTISDCGYRRRREPSSRSAPHLPPEQRRYREKPSQRSVSVGRMVRRSEKSVHEEKWWGRSRDWEASSAVPLQRFVVDRRKARGWLWACNDDGSGHIEGRKMIDRLAF